MNNYNLTGADRLTHLKIVVVSLVAATVMVCVGIAARATLPDMNTRMETRAAMFKAGKPVNWTQAEITAR